jgi:hypothetical protein
MLVKAIIEAEDIDELNMIEGDMFEALTFYSRKNPGITTSIEKYIHENRIVIKILRMNEQSN